MANVEVNLGFYLSLSYHWPSCCRLVCYFCYEGTDGLLWEQIWADYLTIRSSIVADAKYVPTPRNSGYFQVVLSYPGYLFVWRIQISRSLSSVLASFKLPDPGANIFVQSLLKFPTWGTHRRSKSPYPVDSPSDITLIAALNNVFSTNNYSRDFISRNTYNLFTTITVYK